MKRLIVIFLSALLCVCSYAGKKKKMFVEYTYKSMKAEGCGVVYTPMWNGDSAILSVSVMTSNGFKFVTTPVLMMKTAMGDVIKLEGQALPLDTREFHDSSSSFLGIGIPGTNLITGFDSGGISMTTYTATANFYLTKEQLNKLKDGIVKVRINTVPYAHEREFKKDKIGRELYRIFREAKWEQEDF